MSTQSLPGHHREEEQEQGNNPPVSTLIEEQPTQTLQDTNKEDEGPQEENTILIDRPQRKVPVPIESDQSAIEDIPTVQEVPSTVANPPHIQGVSEKTERESEVSAPAASVSQQAEASELQSPAPLVQTPLPMSPPQQVPSAVPKRGASFPVRWLIIGLIALVILAGSIGGLVLLLRSHASGTSSVVPTQSSQRGVTPDPSVCPSATVSTSSSCLATQINATPIIVNGTVDLTFSGAVVGHMTVTRIVTCGPAQSIAGGMQYYVALFGTISGQQYAFTFSVYPYTNPASYTNTVSSFFGPAGEVSSIAKWRSAPNLGVSVTVNSDGKSGSLDIGYVSSADHSTAHVVGSWKCA